MFVDRLKEEGNDVTHFHHEFGFHGFFSADMGLPEVQETLNDMADYIVKNL